MAVDETRLKTFTEYYKAMQEKNPPVQYIQLLAPTAPEAILQTTPRRINWWLIAAVAIILILGAYIYRLRTTEAIKAAEHSRDEIVRDIDSLTSTRDAVIDDNVTSSRNHAKNSNQLINKLPNEKIIIPDTTDSYKRHYITNYRPGAGIEADTVIR